MLFQKVQVKFPFFIAAAIVGIGALKAQTPAPSPTATVVVLPPSNPKLGKGSHFDELHVGTRIYRDVTVREVTVRSILVSDTDGIASIPLRELPPDLQRAFGYQPALEAASNNRIAVAEKHAEVAQRSHHRAETLKSSGYPAGKFGAIAFLLDQKTPPQIEAEVDLRPRFQEFGLTIKDQGRRPSCVVFALVSALEFENAEVTAKFERLSEDYVIWATCQTLKRAPQLIRANQLALNDDEEDHDMGFSFLSVLESLHVFGIATETEMPDSFVHYGKIAAPAAELIRDVASRRKLIIHYVPGETNAARLRNIVEFLNQGVPIPIGVFWPSNRSVRTGFLDTQTPSNSDGHAITLVGYKSSDGTLEHTEFIFRNSYGTRWGDQGYGRASFHYLEAYLQSAVALEIQDGGGPEPARPSSQLRSGTIGYGP